MADSVQIPGATQSSTSSGSLLLHLHAHLPFVRHPEEPVFLEESWLFEAITDTYLPLLMRLQRLHDDGVAGTISMTMSPPLCEMLADPLLQQRYENYLANLCRLIDQEVEAKSMTPFAAAAEMYYNTYMVVGPFGSNVAVIYCRGSLN